METHPHYMVTILLKNITELRTHNVVIGLRIMCSTAEDGQVESLGPNTSNLVLLS